VSGPVDLARWRHELSSLTELAEASPVQKRRVAELYELLDDDETACVWGVTRLRPVTGTPSTWWSC